VPVKDLSVSARIGFFINPIAGMGGRVGLKGTDGVVSKALALGAKPVAQARAAMFLRSLKRLCGDKELRVFTCPSPMGESEVVSVRLKADVLPLPIAEPTTAEDTKLAVREMMNRGVNPVVFVGGDGTARDVLEASHAKKEAFFLGVPAGVKMYSGVFANTVEDAAEVVAAHLRGQAQIMDFEVVDVDEEDVRRDRFSVRICGYLRGPFVPLRLAGVKRITPDTPDEFENQRAAARFVLESMDPNGVYLLGPGKTVKALADLLSVEKTLLGVDIYSRGRVVKDVNEARILREVKDFGNVRIVVSPIGRQGILFGRGNQQISPEIINQVGREKVIVIATKGKMQEIGDAALRVDTGDPEVDRLLRGHIKAIVGYREWRMVQVC